MGSLVDSYEFKDGGLLKKTIKVILGNRQYRLISYYSLEDAKQKLRTPRDDPRLRHLTISQELLRQTHFKVPNLDDPGDQAPHQCGGYYYPGEPHYYPYPSNTMAGFAYPAVYTPYHFPIAGYGMPP